MLLKSNGQIEEWRCVLEEVQNRTSPETIIYFCVSEFVEHFSTCEDVWLLLLQIAASQSEDQQKLSSRYDQVNHHH